MKRRAFLFASFILSVVPRRLLALKKPARRCVVVTCADDLKPGMMMDYRDRGKEGTIRFVREINHGEVWKDLEGKEMEINNRYCNKWWVEKVSNPGELFPCCFDHPGIPFRKMEFYTT
jgi:hypothetical protein